MKSRLLRWIALYVAIFLSGFVFSRMAMAQTPHAWNCFPEATLTDSIYWAAQPTPVQALQNLTEPTLSSTAVQLATQGYVIDNAIMVWHWDAVCTMGMREQQGYTNVPSLLQPNTTGPPGAGAIKVSTNAADYPPFAAPPAPKPAASNLVGVCYDGGPLGKTCSFGPALTAANPANGSTVIENGVSYVVHSTAGPFGLTQYLTVQ